MVGVKGSASGSSLIEACIIDRLRDLMQARGDLLYRPDLGSPPFLGVGSSCKGGVSIVIPVRSLMEDGVVECVGSLVGQSFEREVEVFVIEDGNRSQARNLGLRHSRCEKVAFIDSDCIADGSWLADVTERLEDLENAGGVGGPTVSPPGSGIFAEAIDWVYGSMLGSLGSPSLYKPSRVVKTRTLSCNNSIYDRRVIERVGGFDDRFQYNEDTMLGSKVSELGLDLYFVPDGVVYHRRKDDLAQLSEKFFGYGVGRARSMLTDRRMVDLHILSLLGVFLVSLFLLATDSVLKMFLPLLYFAGVVVETIRGAISKRRLKFLAMIPMLFFTQHLSYALGLILGFTKGPWSKPRTEPRIALYLRIPGGDGGLKSEEDLMPPGSSLPPPKMVSIVVSNYNGTEKLDRCLSSLMETDYPSFEVVVVDCVTVDIKAWMKYRFPNVRLLNFDTDIGVSAQRNAGLRLTDPDSEVVVFVDNDVVVEPVWLGNLVGALYLDPRFGAAQPLLLGLDGHGSIDSVGGYIDRLGFVVLPAHSPSRVRGLNSGKVVPIFFCEAITAVKRSVLRELGRAFDPDFMQHYEDVDLGWRVHLLGYEVVLVGNSLVRHARGVSAGLLAQPPYTVYLNTRNRLTTLLKCYGGWSLVKYVPATVVFEALKSILLFFVRGDHSIALIMGFLDTLFDFRVVWRKRLNVQSRLRRIGDEEIGTILEPSLVRLIRDFGRHYGHGSR